MKSKILNYLKRTGILICLHPVANLIGMLCAAVFSMILRMIIKDVPPTPSPVSTPVLLIAFSQLFILIFIQQETLIHRYQSPRHLLLSALPYFAIQYLAIVFFGGYSLTINCGLSSIVNPICLFIETHYQNVLRASFYSAELMTLIRFLVNCVIQLLLQLFVYLPTYFLAFAIGYHRRKQYE